MTDPFIRARDWLSRAGGLLITAGAGMGIVLADGANAMAVSDAVAAKLTAHGHTALGEHADITPDDVKQILRLAL